MTREVEEAIEHLRTIGEYYSTDHSDPNEEYEILTKDELDAIYLAIKALEQEPILDKIRAEIEHVIDNTYDSTDHDKSLYNGAYKDGLYDALDIIDKYMKEQEE